MKYCSLAYPLANTNFLDLLWIGTVGHIGRASALWPGGCGFEPWPKMVLAALSLGTQHNESRAETDQTSVSIMWLSWISCHVPGRDISVRQHSKWSLSSWPHPVTIMLWLKLCWKRCKTRVKQTRSAVIWFSPNISNYTSSRRKYRNNKV